MQDVNEVGGGRGAVPQTAGGEGTTGLVMLVTEEEDCGERDESERRPLWCVDQRGGDNGHLGRAD